MDCEGFKGKKTVICVAMMLALSACNGGGESSVNETKKEIEEKTALIETQILATNHVDCLDGGVKVIAGYDDDKNGTLEPNEYVSEQSICNDGTSKIQQEGQEVFAKAIVSVSFLTKEDQNCPTGGQKIDAGVDKNSNTLLDKQEVIFTRVLCSSAGANFAPDPIINAVVVNPSVVSPSSTVSLTANISNLSASDVVLWTNNAGETLASNEQNGQSILEVTTGATSGKEVYSLFVQTINNKGKKVTQYKNIEVTVSESAAPTQKIVLDTSSVFLPDGYKTQQLIGDTVGAVIYGENNSIAPMSSIPTPENTELVGVVTERGSLNQGSSALEILLSSANAYSSSLQNVTSFQQTSQTILKNGDVSASYNIKLWSGKKLTEMLQSLVSQVAVNSSSGSVSALVASASEKTLEEYQLDIIVSYDNVIDIAVITATLVEKSKATKYADLIIATTSESIKASDKATLALKNDEFIAVDQKTTKADFLFVIDNSGSMGDEQTALSTLATVFTTAISNAGVDYKVGTITTDSDALRNTGFTSDIEQIKKDLKPGTWGAPYERGIYWSEKALSVGGTAEAQGYPRANASLSVVIMSDEESQYSGQFDPRSNLFVDNGYRVYSIVDPSHAGVSQYDDLATSTLGKTLNINVTDEYQSFVETMAQNAGASSAGYELTLADTNSILSSSIAVKVDGQVIPRNATNGWQYYALSQSVVFTGIHIPNAGAKITIAYQYVEEVKN